VDSLGENDVILFQDEASIQFSPTITRMWALKGQLPEVLTHGGRLRLHLIGAVDPLPGIVHTALSKTLKAKQFKQFLEGILMRYKEASKILLVLDNARTYHSKELEPFLNANK